MKLTVLLIISFLFMHFGVYAQDRIILKEDREVSCKVERLTAQIVYFVTSGTSVFDSIPTEKIREVVLNNNSKRLIVLPKTYQNQIDLVDQNQFWTLLQKNNPADILHSKTILAGVNFYTGKYILTSDARKQLLDVFKVLKQNKVSQIEIVVHSDTVGKASNNLELSEKRAQSIRHFLLENGLKAGQIKVSGRGEAEPIFGGTGTQVQNRRVELQILGIEGVELLYSEKYTPPAIVVPNESLEVVVAPSVETFPQSETNTLKVRKKTKGTRIGQIPSKKTPKIQTKSSVDSKSNQKISIQLVLGVLTTYPLGASIDRTRTTFAEETELSDSTQSFKNTVWPEIFVSGGIELKYRLTPKWTVVSGLRFARQGFSLRRTYTYRDPQYQYDEVYKGRIFYRSNTLDIPIFMEGKLNKRISIGVGGSVAMAVSERQQKITYTKKVSINGKRSAEDSVKWQEQINDISDYTKGLIPTALFNIGIQTSRHLGIQIRGQYSINQFKDKGKAQNAAAFVGIAYQF